MGRHRRREAEPVTFGAYSAGWLANRQVAGRPIKARTREHYQQILDDHLLPTFGHRQLAAIKPKDVRAWYEATLVDRPTMRSHAYSLLRTIMASAVNDEIIDANPARIVGAGRAKRVHKIRPASVEELGVLTAEMPEKLRLMVTLASWCALRFGEAVELRRGDIDLSDEVIRVRRAAVRSRRHLRDHHTEVRRRNPRRGHPAAHHPADRSSTWRNTLTTGRDSLIFPADNGGHLQPSTLYRHWYRARDEGRSQRPALARPTPFRCGAGRRDRRELGRTDGAPRPFDPAGGDALPARRQGPGPRDRRAAVQAGRERGGGALNAGKIYYSLIATR